MDSKKIGNLIRKKRNELGITQEELAKKLNITDKAVSKWESGNGTPDISIISNLAKELDIDVGELLNGREKENKGINYVEKYNNVKNKHKEKFENIIKFCVLFWVIFAVLGTIISLLGNTLKIYDPNFDLNFSVYDTKEFDELYNDTKEKIEIIKNTNNSKYTTDEKNVIIEYLTYLDDNIDELINIMVKNDKVNFWECGALYNKVFSLSDPNKVEQLSELNEIVKKYSDTNKSLREHIENFEFYNEYHLQSSNSYLFSMEFVIPKLYYKNNISIFNLQLDWKIKYYNEITSFLMEVGDINEQ